MKRVPTIAETIRQKVPFESVHVESLTTLVRASDLARDRASVPLRAQELSMPQYNVLRILRGSPDGLQTHQVLDRLVSRAPNVTRLVDKLEAKGLIRRIRSRTDRRVVTLRITAAGLEMLQALDDAMRAAVADAMRGLSVDDHARLCDLLNRLRQPLESAFEDAGGDGGATPGAGAPTEIPERPKTNRPRPSGRRVRKGESAS